MKLIDVDYKATLEDFLTLKKKTELVQFLWKCNEKISGIKNELTLRIAQYFRFAEKSGDNHPKHFRKLIM
jgi:hypothetical protein